MKIIQVNDKKFNLTKESGGLLYSFLINIPIEAKKLKVVEFCISKKVKLQVTPLYFYCEFKGKLNGITKDYYFNALLDLTIGELNSLFIVEDYNINGF